MGIFTEDPLKPWEIARGQAYQALAKAERIHDATLRMLQRVEQANFDHHERDLDPSGARAGNKTPAMEVIGRDNEVRARFIADAKAVGAAKFIIEYVDKMVRRGYP
jgi:hypothetical protein